MLRNFVINVPHNLARQQFITEQFGKNDVAFEFFEAVTPPYNNEVRRQLGIDNIATACTEVEISCLLSHVSLWHHCVTQSLDYIGIFEDDICLGNEARFFLTDDKWLKDTDEHIIKLEKSGERVKLGKFPKDIQGTDRKLYTLLSRNVGAAGYILSRQGAQYLIQLIQELSHLDAIDIILFDNEKYPKALPVQLLIPSLVIQESALFHDGLSQANLNSQLGEHRGKELKIKKTLSQRIKKQLERSFRGLYMTPTSFK